MLQGYVSDVKAGSISLLYWILSHTLIIKPKDLLVCMLNQRLLHFIYPTGNSKYLKEGKMEMHIFSLTRTAGPISKVVKSFYYCLKERHRAQVGQFWRKCGLSYLCSFKDKVMDDNLFFIREAQPVFADKGNSKGLTVHGFFSTWPVHKLILCLWEPGKQIILQCYQIFVFQFSCKPIPHICHLPNHSSSFTLIL